MPAPEGQEQTPERLAADQARRERVERELAAAAPADEDARIHARRAEQAEYLRAKLDDQVQAERDA